MKTLKTIFSLLLIYLILLCLAGCSSGRQEDVSPSSENVEMTQADDDTLLIETDLISDDPDPEPVNPEPAPEGAALIIYGDAVDSQTNWTLEDLQALTDGYREITYSTTNNWPSFSYMTGHGVSIPYLLELAGMHPSAATFVFISPDGYKAVLTKEQLFGAMYSYAEHSASGSGGETQVEAIIAWEWGDGGEAEPGYLRPLFGQRGPYETNSAASVKDLYRIEVSARKSESWSVPEASVDSGSQVAKGTGIEFTHPNIDNVRLYYTLDGSEPDYLSEVYNRSATYFQPDLIIPITIDKDITVKIFAGGIGKEDSPVVVFTYTVS